jgi:hypothetical protein
VRVPRVAAAECKAEQASQRKGDKATGSSLVRALHAPPRWRQAGKRVNVVRPARVGSLSALLAIVAAHLGESDSASYSPTDCLPGRTRGRRCRHRFAWPRRSTRDQGRHRILEASIGREESTTSVVGSSNERRCALHSPVSYGRPLDSPLESVNRGRPAHLPWLQSGATDYPREEQVGTSSAFSPSSRRLSRRPTTRPSSTTALCPAPVMGDLGGHAALPPRAEPSGAGECRDLWEFLGAT